VTESNSSNATAYVVLEGGLEHDQIAALYHSDPHALLIIFSPPRRLEVAGLRPRRDVADRKALEARGLPHAAIHTLPARYESTWESVRVLGDWLHEHPMERVAVLCSRFNSRRQRLILDRVLGDQTKRVDVVALVDPRYDESNWWQRKEGAVAFQTGLTLLSYNWIAGEGERRITAWEPDAYERTLP
jgi:hypothetical protein